MSLIVIVTRVSVMCYIISRFILFTVIPVKINGLLSRHRINPLNWLPRPNNTISQISCSTKLESVCLCLLVGWLLLAFSGLSVVYLCGTCQPQTGYWIHFSDSILRLTTGCCYVWLCRIVSILLFGFQNATIFSSSNRFVVSISLTNRIDQEPNFGWFYL